MPPPCSCDMVPMLREKTGASLGHKWIKATNVNTQLFCDLFNISGNSILKPDFEKINFDIDNQISNLIAKNFCDVDHDHI